MPLKIGRKPAAPTPPTQEVKSEVREAIAQAHADDSVILRHQTPDVIVPDESTALVPALPDDDSITDADRKMERLIANDFPFDETQLAAVNGLISSQYGCMTGAAGTGKTTTTQKLVDELVTTTSIGRVDMRQYWSKEGDERQDAYDDSDDYSFDESNPVIPTILMCSFTGRATQQIKRNFPRSWHGNIMTIHRALGFMPVWEDVWDDEWIDKDTGLAGAYRPKMRFKPTYTADCLMPWDIIIIDEAGMLGLDLWHQLLAATKPTTRIYMVGDINQLPPVHGKSIFGFAMAKWPAYELTHVHRQQGKDNPIVDNAWRIIHGQMPQSEGRFMMVELKGDAQKASQLVRGYLTHPEKGLKARGVYDPIRDTVITPINGEYGARGFALGQIPLNADLALRFNPESEHPRYMIDGGRDKKQFAVGDKVMATRNDWEAGITNGMTGIIESIVDNGAYAGNRMHYGLLSEVNANFAAEGVDESVAFSLDDLDQSMDAIEKGREATKVSRERGPSSHIVTVRFGSEEHGFTVPFQTLAEVGSLQMAYVVTCHKMQGGESPTVIIICHDAHRHMLYREWLYTAVTRASQRCIIFYTRDALQAALTKQTIKGRTLREKVVSFNALMDPKGEFDWNKEVKLPHCESTALTIMDRPDEQVVTPARLTTDAERSGGVASLLRKRMAQEQPKPLPTQEIHIHVKKIEVVNRVVVERPDREQPTQQPAPIDGGTLKAQRLDPTPTVAVAASDRPQPPALPAPKPRAVSQWGAIHMALKLSAATENANRLLTYVPRVSEPDENATLLDGPLDSATQIIERRAANQAMVATTVKAATESPAPRKSGLNFLIGKKKKES